MSQSTARRTRRTPAPAPEGSDAGRFAFDADAKTRELREAPITIDGTVYHRRIKNNEVSMKAQDMLDRQDVLNRRANAKRTEAAELDDAQVVEYEALVREASELTNETVDITYAVVALLLEDEAGNPPDVAVISKKLDIQVVGPLAVALTRGGEPVEGPTPTTGSSD